MSPPPIIEGCEADPKACINCGQLRTSLHLCRNCGYHSGAFTAATALPPQERRINTVLRRIYDAMIEKGILRRSK